MIKRFLGFRVYFSFWENVHNEEPHPLPPLLSQKPLRRGGAKRGSPLS